MERPNKFFYIVINRLARIYTRCAKNHRFHNPHKIKVQSPSFVISNHTSFFDFLYVMWAFKNTPVNFVVARKYFETKPLSSFLKWARTIPKSLFQADTLAIKHILEVIKLGGVISIFPEGQISTTGVTLPFPQGFGKLIKKIGIPVYAVKTTGAYLKDPPWTSVRRKGHIDSELTLALSPEEIVELSVNEIEEKLYQAIYTNPYTEQSQDFKGNNLAKGLDNILYLCPHCHSEGKMTAKLNELTCKECGFQYHVQADGWLTHQDGKINIHDAYFNQREYEKERMTKTPQFSLMLSVAVETIINQHYQIASHGTVVIGLDEIKYLSNDDYQFTVPTQAVQYVPFDTGRNFQIYSRNQLYQFIPEKPYLATKAAILIEELHTIKVKQLVKKED
jgi:1-acyl-sn-glycerol-3-phosphate acyltransferase